MPSEFKSLGCLQHRRRGEEREGGREGEGEVGREGGRKKNEGDVDVGKKVRRNYHIGDFIPMESLKVKFVLQIHIQ